MKEGSIWFQRLVKDAKKISPHIRIKHAKLGFYRIYWKQIYVHEIYKEAPLHGYDFEIVDPRLEDRRYFEEYEDTNEITRKIKNYKEGYWDALDTIKTRVYMMRHSKEFYDNAEKAYKQVAIR